jgi:cytochrome c oxidase assembly factor 2
MPPALHPKSFTTASLFTSTAVLAFLVVGAPHILPCPAPKQQYTDDGGGGGNGKGGERTKKKKKCPVPRLGGKGVVVKVEGEGR